MEVKSLGWVLSCQAFAKRAWLTQPTVNQVKYTGKGKTTEQSREKAAKKAHNELLSVGEIWS